MIKIHFNAIFTHFTYINIRFRKHFVQNKLMANRQRNIVPNRDRRRLVETFENGDDYLLLAAQMNINRHTARSVIRVWMDEARVDRLPMGGRRNGNLKVDDEMLQAILETVRERDLLQR